MRKRPGLRAILRAELAVGEVVSGSVVIGAIAAVTVLVAATGGAPNTWAHLYYLPIIYAAVRHGFVRSVITAIAAALAAGPWMPSSFAGAEHQEFTSWMVRLVIFVVVGILAAWLARAQVRSVDALMHDQVVSRSLRGGMRRGHVGVHYQPLVSLGTGDVVGFEALCRWHDGRGQFRPPDLFIPQAERTGLIVDLGAQVLHEAAKQAQRWADAGHSGLLMTVNVSAVQLSHPGFLSEVLAVARSHSIEEYEVCLEVTESAVIVDPECARETLRAARDLGMKVAVDDFGTGQSSLAYLADFPIDIVKIDRTFIAGLGTDPKANALVGAMVAMARALGAVTIAEGIETREQLAAVRSLGCEIGQGFYLGRPVPAERIDWITRALVGAR